MLSSRPYLARALYEWLLDNDHTPYIVVDAEGEGVQVPEQFVQNGQIVLNIAPGAVRELNMANDAVTFNARFGGHPMQVVVPGESLIAIYARENGVGMVFGHEPVMPGYEAQASESPAPEEEQRPNLESVDGKSGAVDDEASPENGDGKAQKDQKKGRPSLRVIK
ncbi:ClpXP protease specificity-enhancing factor [Modicisalibacter radicis]|uniref:ClpXP protease specificity-enhancing factor n=1 Tax=Halomonas sp. EAR18 TaxID=2518972 RepID=UPI00109C0966|nr:ClpXP protease specificity-enhancing factor [Halomonas sp. EAR18]